MVIATVHPRDPRRNRPPAAFRPHSARSAPVAGSVNPCKCPISRGLAGREGATEAQRTANSSATRPSRYLASGRHGHGRRTNFRRRTDFLWKRIKGDCRGRDRFIRRRVWVRFIDPINHGQGEASQCYCRCRPGRDALGRRWRYLPSRYWESPGGIGGRSGRRRGWQRAGGDCPSRCAPRRHRRIAGSYDARCLGNQLLVQPAYCFQGRWFSQHEPDQDTAEKSNAHQMKILQLSENDSSSS